MPGHETIMIVSNCSASTHILPSELAVKKVGSVGLLLPNQEARLVDDDENDVKPGERGELWIRGPNIMKYAYFSLTKILPNRELDNSLCQGIFVQRRRNKKFHHTRWMVQDG